VNTAPNSADQVAVDQAYRKLRASGIDHGTAMSMAEQYVLDHKQGASDKFNANRTANRAAKADAERRASAVANAPPPEQEMTPDELRAAGQNPYTEPGPNMPDGRRAAKPRAMEYKSEAETYNTRPQLVPQNVPSGPQTPLNKPPEYGDTERYGPSPRDLANNERGYVATYNDDGTVSYRLSPTTGVAGLPGALGRGGRRSDLEGPMLDENGRPIKVNLGPDLNGNPQGNGPAPRFVPQVRNGPTGEQVVYGQSDLTQRRNNAYQAERRLYRMSQQAGVSPAEFRKSHPELFTDLEVPVAPPQSQAPTAQPPGQFGLMESPTGSPAAPSRTLAAKPQLVRSGVGARMAVQGARQEKAQQREDAWRSQMMLSGGQPNRAQKAAINGYLQLGDPNVSDWQKAVMANRLAPDMDNTTPLTVDAMGAQNALRFLNSTNLGANMFNPMAQAAQQAQIDQMNSQKTPEEQLPLHRDKPDIHPAELSYADTYTGQHYSADQAMGISSEFTISEQQAVIDHLVNDKGYSLPKAQKIVDEIARRRHSQSWMGSPQRDPATGAAAPPPTAPPGSDPAAWGGGV